MDINLEKILTVLFKLTIFFLLVVQLVQLTTQYFLPFLRKQIKSFYKLWEDLQAKLDLLARTKKSLKKKIKNQDENLKNLEQKIERWHKSLEHKHAQEKKEQKIIIDRLQEKKLIEYKKISKLKEEKAILPKALDLAKEKLKKNYSGEKGKLLLSKVITQLKSTQNGDA